MADDFENIQMSALGDGCTGRAVYERKLADFLASFDDLRYEIEDVIAEDDKVAVAYRMSAVADGSPIDLRGAMLITVENGLIARRVDYWDGVTYLRQVANEGNGTP